MSDNLTAIAAVGVLVGFALLVMWAKREGRIIAETQADVAALEAGDEIKEKSRESSEAAADRSDPRVHDVDVIVPNERIPAWLKR